MISFGTIVLGILCYAFILKEIRDTEKRRIEREKIFHKWMFDSLYSLNNKVLLPEEHEKPTINKKARVYSPTEDGLAEFNGLKDDLE